MVLLNCGGGLVNQYLTSPRKQLPSFKAICAAYRNMGSDRFLSSLSGSRGKGNQR